METSPHDTAAIGLHLAAPKGRDGTDGKYAGPAEAGPQLRFYSIREMAREFHVTIRALRFYEDRGMLQPRREGSVRRYDDRDRLHLKMILKGKQLGFTLSEIQGILAGQEDNPGKADLEMGLSPELIAAQISHLEQQRRQIEDAIAALREAQRRLRESLPPSEDGADRCGH